MFFDRRCPVCGKAQRTVCRPCVDQFELVPAAEADELAVVGLASLTSLFRYDETSSRLILAGKNGGRRDLLRWAGTHLAGVIERELAAADQIDAVTWVPAHPEQRSTRGYDQGEVLARAVARQLSCRSRPLLSRRAGASRKGLPRIDRLAGPAVEVSRSVSGAVLLVDDVMTTGTSLERCAAALLDAGAEQVFGAVVAASTERSAGLRAQNDSRIYIGTSSGNRPQAT